MLNNNVVEGSFYANSMRPGKTDKESYKKLCPGDFSQLYDEYEEDYEDYGDNYEGNLNQMNTFDFKGLLGIMILQYLKETKYFRMLTEIFEGISQRFENVLFSSDQKLDMQTVKRYIDDLCEADYLPFKLEAFKDDDGVKLYRYVENEDIKNLPDKIPGRLKSTAIYEFLLSNRGQEFSAGEIERNFEGKISAKTIRTTLREHAYYMQIPNFDFLLSIDTYQSPYNKDIVKYAVEVGRINFIA